VCSGFIFFPILRTFYFPGQKPIRTVLTILASFTFTVFCFRKFEDTLNKMGISLCMKSFELHMSELNQTHARHCAWVDAAISFTVKLVDNDTFVTPGVV
jgi:hypothetical protein